MLERVLDIVWLLDGEQTVLEFAGKGAVRSGLIYHHQTVEVRKRIRDAPVPRSSAALHQEGTGIASPGVLFTAREP